METVLIIVEFILAIIMIALVLMQQSKSDGLKGLTGGSSQDSFFSKNRGRTGEAFLKKLTVITAILFAINTIAMNMI
ncbi:MULTISPECIES: preprotein translocase subunit SecG [Proteiniclasticum]|jgi:preprotein translocase subunit SecG|uniref:Protein-export membrane protein SecG n=1 Tax=Proteiniclasticum ruminis TaxID=398199 RepID=A0A1G8H284_9CLOT|nr:MULTISPECIES: preprotein translocase subunit SecG [Proteiniclasticum]SDI00747.1 preprotein translocase subunit SecG [Proteiniclasticum ruminis]SFN43228.1 preprotein translocase subunit SecG [Proteiniclasticum ruminis]HBW13827.1 preprotein translocase subunit SecG [Proteiniclasticum sp.]